MNLTCFEPVSVIFDGNIFIQEPINERTKTKDVTKNIIKSQIMDKKFPKIRISLESLEELKKIRRDTQCKSYCEVVEFLIDYYIQSKLTEDCK
ncbi:hypothetical protein ENUP19_0327G0038 [Entamoeba nuttalli]|uniref:CopG family transcriptional regulator n=1 Tax=Entamoeba nuttalli TaxID=412467 RepID=A0ABQ0DV28_9EUKA